MNSGCRNLVRQFTQGERRLRRSRVCSPLELGGQADPQAFERELRLSQSGADVEDLAGHLEGIAHVVRPVEREAPVQQDGCERLPVTGPARHDHRPVAELEPLPVGALGVQPVVQAGEDQGLGPALLLAQPLERLL